MNIEGRKFSVFPEWRGSGPTSGKYKSTKMADFCQCCPCQDYCTAQKVYHTVVVWVSICLFYVKLRNNTVNYYSCVIKVLIFILYHRRGRQNSRGDSAKFRVFHYLVAVCLWASVLVYLRDDGGEIRSMFAYLSQAVLRRWCAGVGRVGAWRSTNKFCMFFLL